MQLAHSVQLDCLIPALHAALFTISSFRKLLAMLHALISTTTTRLILPAMHALWIVKYA